MGIAQDKIWIFEDKRACIHITENNMSPGNQRTLHVDILEKFRSELEVNNEVGAVYAPTQHNPADILTKIQTTEAFLRSKKQASAPRDILPPLVSEWGGVLNSKTTQRSDAIFIIQINLEKKN